MRARPTLRFWHRWFGIIGGVWLLLLAVTGCAIAWYDEIDGLLNPDLRYSAAATGPQAPIDDIVASAKAALPGFDPNNILLAQEPSRNHWLLGRQGHPDGSGTPLQVFIDPVSAQFAGARESGKFSLHRHHLPDLIYGLHTDLLLGEAGILLVGLIALAWLFDHLISLLLAFPRFKGALSAFRIGGHAGSLRQLWDRHRASGIWLWLVTAMLALTGVTLSFPEQSRAVISQVTPVGERLHYAMEESDQPAEPVGLDAAILQASKGSAKVHSVRLHSEVGQYAVRTFDTRDVDNQGRMWTYVDMQTGKVFAQRHDAGETAGDAFFVWQYALHSGQAFGLVGRLIVTLAGIVTAYLCMSGYLLWWRRRRSNQGRSKLRFRH